MATAVIEKLKTERDELVNAARALMEADGFDPDDTTYTESKTRAADLDRKIRAMVEFEESRTAADKIDALFGRVTEQAALRHRQGRDDEPLTLGEMWVRSQAYEDFKGSPRGNSGRVHMPVDMLTRALIKTDTFTGLIRPDRIDPSTPPAQQTPLIDLIRTVRVMSNSVEWVFYPAAAPLGTVTAEGAAKTEAAITPSLKTVTLSTIASWAQYSRQFGEDAPGLVDFLNASLARGIMDKREALAAAALVASGDIPVTTNTSGTLLQGIRRAVATVQSAGYSPNAVVLNPQDYAALDLDVLGKTLLGPVVGSQFWGITPVPVGAITSGTAFVGDFSVGMAELVRSEVSVYTTDSDITGAGATAASAFRANILTTLVEARSAPIIHRPEAITKVAGTVLGALGAESTSAKK